MRPGCSRPTLALDDKLLPAEPRLRAPNPNIDWRGSPFSVNTELREWQQRDGEPRVAGVSAFGFGGTNFHAVLEEHVPGRFSGNGRSSIAVRRAVRQRPLGVGPRSG